MTSHGLLLQESVLCQRCCVPGCTVLPPNDKLLPLHSWGFSPLVRTAAVTRVIMPMVYCPEKDGESD